MPCGFGRGSKGEGYFGWFWCAQEYRCLFVLFPRWLLMRPAGQSHSLPPVALQSTPASLSPALLGGNCLSSFSEEAELLLRLKWTAPLTACLPTDTCQCLCRLSVKLAKMTDCLLRQLLLKYPFVPNILFRNTAVRVDQVACLIRGRSERTAACDGWETSLK